MIILGNSAKALSLDFVHTQTDIDCGDQVYSSRYQIWCFQCFFDKLDKEDDSSSILLEQ